MWLATPGGSSNLANGRWQVYTRKNGLPSNNINCLFEDSSGVLWIGTTGGLAFRGARGFQSPVGLPAPLRESIMGMAEDGFGSLWLATSNHVLQVNRGPLLRGTLAGVDLREYGLTDGLRGVEGVKRHQSVFKDSGGRIWFSLNRGISVVDPARLTRNATASIVHIQKFSADGRAIDFNHPFHIPARSIEWPSATLGCGFQNLNACDIATCWMASIAAGAIALPNARLSTQTLTQVCIAFM